MEIESANIKQMRRGFLLLRVHAEWLAAANMDGDMYDVTNRDLPTVLITTEVSAPTTWPLPFLCRMMGHKGEPTASTL